MTNTIPARIRIDDPAWPSMSQLCRSTVSPPNEPTVRRRPVRLAFSLLAHGLAVLACTVAAVGTSLAASPESTCDPYPAGGCTRLNVSIVELIAAPEKFDQKLIRVDGYLRLEFEGNALYLHKEDAEVGLTRNGLWLSLDDKAQAALKACKSNSYVSLQGQFVLKESGHMGLWSAGLRELSRCVPLQ